MGVYRIQTSKAKKTCLKTEKQRLAYALEQIEVAHIAAANKGLTSMAARLKQASREVGAVARQLR